MEINFLGVGGAINSTSFHTSILVENKILIDTPPSIGTHLNANEIDLQNIDSILISHLHGDHFFGLPLLLIEYSLSPRTKPLRIFGPEGFEEKILTLVKLSFPEYEPMELIRASKPEFFEYKEIDNFIESDDLHISAIEVPHSSLKAYGFNLQNDSTSVFFSADSEFFSGLEQILINSQYAILDGTTLDIPLPTHMNYRQIKDIASKHKDIWFFVTHRSNYKADSLPSNVIFPQDTEIYKLWMKQKPKIIKSAV